MKRIALISALTLVVSGVALAQQTAPAPDTQSPAPIVRPHTKAAKETARLTKELDLTPDQSAKLEPILADRDAHLATLTGNTSLSDDDRREQIKAVRKAAQIKMRDVLTPAQQQQLKDMKKKPTENHTTENSPSTT